MLKPRWSNELRTFAGVPWEVVVLPPGGDPAVSEMMSGCSRGILSSHVDESARLIRIFNVVWIG
jgi:hypothetical protein